MIKNFFTAEIKNFYNEVDVLREKYYELAKHIANLDHPSLEEIQILKSLEYLSIIIAIGEYEQLKMTQAQQLQIGYEKSDGKAINIKPTGNESLTIRCWSGEYQEKYEQIKKAVSKEQE